VDLLSGLRRGAARHLHRNLAPLVCQDVVVVGSSLSDFAPGTTMPVGDVRGYDAVSGRERWTFHAIPEEGEMGVETWENDSWKSAGNTNVWTLMSCDPELGYVYLPFE
jgi:quinoprotein glucose dehydrogenase